MEILRNAFKIVAYSFIASTKRYSPHLCASHSANTSTSSSSVHTL